MPATHYNLEFMVDGSDQVLGIMPPVEVDFREEMYGKLEGMGLIKEIAIREGSFFATQHLPDGRAYSSLRVPTTALQVAGQSMVKLARESADVLEGLGHEAEVSPYLLTVGGSRRLFQRPDADR